jgi:hypothetical protein
MSKATYLRAQDVTFTSPSPTVEAYWSRVDVIHRTPLIDVTGSSNSGGDTDKAFLAGIPVMEYIASGWVWDSTDKYASSNAITLTPGSTPINIHPWEWTYSKTWELNNVTGGSGTQSDTISAWKNGVGTIKFQVRGWITAPRGPSDISSQSVVGFSATFDLGGVIAGTAMIESYDLSAPRGRGGPMYGTISGNLNAGYTYATSGSNPADYSNIFAPDKDPPSGTTSLVTTSGNTLSNTCLVYDVQLKGTRRQGGGVGIVARHRADMA